MLLKQLIIVKLDCAAISYNFNLNPTELLKISKFLNAPNSPADFFVGKRL